MRGKVPRKDIQASDGRKLRIVLGQAGSERNQAEIREIAYLLSIAGFEVVYMGCRLTSDEIFSAAIEHKADLIGLSVFSRRRSLMRRLLDQILEGDVGEALARIRGFFMIADIPGKMVGVKEIFAPGARLQEIADWVNDNVAARGI